MSAWASSFGRASSFFSSIKTRHKYFIHASLKFTCGLVAGGPLSTSSSVPPRSAHGNKALPLWVQCMHLLGRHSRRHRTCRDEGPSPTCCDLDHIRRGLWV